MVEKLSRVWNAIVFNCIVCSLALSYLVRLNRYSKEWKDIKRNWVPKDLPILSFISISPFQESKKGRERERVRGKEKREEKIDCSLLC